jgi:hypothetical protein
MMRLHRLWTRNPIFPNPSDNSYSIPDNLITSHRLFRHRTDFPHFAHIFHRHSRGFLGLNSFHHNRLIFAYFVTINLSVTRFAYFYYPFIFDLIFLLLYHVFYYFFYTSFLIIGPVGLMTIRSITSPLTPRSYLLYYLMFLGIKTLVNYYENKQSSTHYSLIVQTSVLSLTHCYSSS